MTATKAKRTAADRIRHLHPCPEALAWLAGYPDTPTGRRKAWRECTHPDWMLWLLGATDDSPAGSPSRRGYVAVACGYARLCLDNFERAFPKDDRPRKSIELCERYAAGEDIPFADLRRAADSAGRAADSAGNAADSAWNAAASAGNAADSAWNAAASAGNAAASAGNAAASAWRAADSAGRAADSAGNAADSQACDLIRAKFPDPPTVSED